MDSGKCEVCSRTAVQSCAHCRMIVYCGKEHQKEHWLIHKATCKPYRIETSEVMGRHMVASRDIKPGELIIKEIPMIVGPRWDSVALCLGCYKTAPNPDTETRHCSRCHVAPICCTDCEIKSHHSGSECDTFARLFKGNPKFNGSLMNYMEIIMPLRCFLKRPEPNEQRNEWENFLNLESHEAKRKNSPIWHHNQEKVVNVLKTAGIISTAEDEILIHKICGILDVNSVELRGPNPALMTHSARKGERLRGIYLEAALMSHDCIGNTHIAVDDDYLLSVHASRLIKGGHPIFFNYVNSLESTGERLHRLLEGKYFGCECKRCSDATELGTYMGSIVCSRCHDGLVIPNNPLQKPRVSNSWYCEKCGHKFDPRLIKSVINQAWSEIEDTDSTDSRALEILLKRLLRTFPQSSVVVLEIKQNLVALYRDIILREPTPSRKVMQRKIALCSELLQYLNIVEPGISRLKGITLYELHTPMVLLANREYDNAEITAESLVNRLQECENILKESVSMLLYEPSNSPEGRLLRVAIDQLRVLRENIHEVKQLTGKITLEGGRKRRNGQKTKR